MGPKTADPYGILGGVGPGAAVDDAALDVLLRSADLGPGAP